MAKTEQAVNPEDVKAVAARIEMSYHLIEALHELCDDGVSLAGDARDSGRRFVLLREALRSLARDMETCTEVLQNDRGGLGFFESHFGSV